MSQLKPTYEELETRCLAAEAMLAEMRARQAASGTQERKRLASRLAEAESALEFNAEQLGLALKAAQAGTWVWDLRTNQNAWSDELWPLYGLELHSCEPSYEAWRQAIHPDDRASAERTVQEAARNGTELNAEWRVIHPDGSEHWLMSRGKPVFDPQGQVIRYIGVVIDITRRRLAEEKLKASEQVLQLFVEYAPAAIAMFDREMRYIAASRRFIMDYRLDVQDVIGRSHYEIFPEISEHWKEIHQRCLAGAVEKAQAEPFPRTDGSLDWVRWEIHPWREPAGRIGGIILFSEVITERIQVEQALAQSEERYRMVSGAIFDYVYSGVAYPDGRSETDWISGAFERITGYCQEEVKNLPLGFASLVYPEDLQEVIASQPVLFEKGSLAVEYRIRRKNGEVRWLRDYIQFIQGEGYGKPARLLGAVQDITERKLAEKARNESEAQFAALFRANPAAVAIARLDDHCLVNVNQAWQELTGYTFQEAVGQTPLALNLWVDPGERQQLVALVRQHGKAKADIRLRRKSGEVREMMMAAEKVELGGQPYLISMALDISERKRAEAELLAHRDRLEEIVRERTAEVEDLYENAPAGYHSLDAEGRFVRINQTELNWLGYTRQELIGRRFTDFVTPESVLTFAANFPAFKRDGQVHDLEFECVRKNGATFPILVNATAIYDEAGKFLMSRSTAFDATERKRSESALRESEEQNRLLFEETPHAIVLLDVAQRFLRVNRAFEELVKLPPSSGRADILGKTAVQLGLVDSVGYAVWQAALEQPLSAHEEYVTAEYTLCCGDGQARNVESRIFHLPLGGVDHILATMRDITTQKQTEEALRRANEEMEQAMRMKDEFLASMSHELRTPLTGILGLSEALQIESYGPISEKQRRAVQNIYASGQHLLELINDILDLSKIESGKFEMQFEMCSLGDVCQSSLQLTRGMAQKKQHKVSFSMQPASLRLRCDPKRLKQMLVNLLSNAIKFTPAGGEVGLTVCEMPEAGLVRITVWDTGIGIVADDLGRLFKPFVQLDSSLSRQHSGTGLGLSLVKRMVEIHGGRLEVQSQPGQGSQFSLLLPNGVEEASQGSVENAFVGQAGKLVPHQDGQAGKLALDPFESLASQIRVMVVDDNDVNVSILVDYLEARKFQVMAMSNGQDFLAQAPEFDPDIVLIDIQMPGMNGLEAIGELRADANSKLSRTLVVAVTALAMPGDRERCLAAGADEYISKPLGLQDTARLIVEMVQNRRR